MDLHRFFNAALDLLKARRSPGDKTGLIPVKVWVTPKNKAPHYRTVFMSVEEYRAWRGKNIKHIVEEPHLSYLNKKLQELENDGSLFSPESIRAAETALAESRAEQADLVAAWRRGGVEPGRLGDEYAYRNPDASLYEDPKQLYIKESRLVLEDPDETVISNSAHVPESVAANIRQHAKDFINQAMDAFLAGEKGVVNFDGTGAGKTRQAIGLAQTYMAKNEDAVCLITTESDKIYAAWQNDFKAMGVQPKLIKSAADIKGPGLYVTLYSRLGAFENAKIDLAIFDEAHNMKNVQSQKTSNGFSVMANATNIAAFTATPVDKPMHFRWLAEVLQLDYEMMLRGLGYFRTKGVGTDKQGKKTPDKWSTNLSTREVMARIDSVMRSIKRAGISVKREFSMSNVDMEIKNIQIPPGMQERIGDLEAAIATGQATGAKGLMALRRLVEEAKVPATVASIKEALKRGEQVVLFATRINDSTIDDEISEGTMQLVADALEKDGISFSKLYGSVKDARGEMNKFQSGQTKVVLATPQQGATGVSFDDTVGNAPRRMIVMTPPFSSVEFAQMLGRINRLNTKSRAKVDVISTSTIADTWGLGIIATKMELLGAAVKGDYQKLNIEDLQLMSSLDPDEIAKFQEAKKVERVTPQRDPVHLDFRSFQKGRNEYETNPIVQGERAAAELTEKRYHGEWNGVDKWFEVVDAPKISRKYPESMIVLIGPTMQPQNTVEYKGRKLYNYNWNYIQGKYFRQSGIQYGYVDRKFHAANYMDTYRVRNADAPRLKELIDNFPAYMEKAIEEWKAEIDAEEAREAARRAKLSQSVTPSPVRTPDDRRAVQEPTLAPTAPAPGPSIPMAGQYEAAKAILGKYPKNKIHVEINPRGGYFVSFDPGRYIESGRFGYYEFVNVFKRAVSVSGSDYDRSTKRWAVRPELLPQLQKFVAEHGGERAAPVVPTNDKLGSMLSTLATLQATEELNQITTIVATARQVKLGDEQIAAMVQTIYDQAMMKYQPAGAV